MHIGSPSVEKTAPRPFLRSTKDVAKTTKHACCALPRCVKPISDLLYALK